uniref:Uncharacterized protein n=1 Tax=Rhizophora mucronata TaxID=61149 RepID=A0A2P2QCI5_RHIMU
MLNNIESIYNFPKIQRAFLNSIYQEIQVLHFFCAKEVSDLSFYPSYNSFH